MKSNLDVKVFILELVRHVVLLKLKYHYCRASYDAVCLDLLRLLAGICSRSEVYNGCNWVEADWIL